MYSTENSTTVVISPRPENDSDYYIIQSENPDLFDCSSTISMDEIQVATKKFLFAFLCKLLLCSV